MSTLEKKTILLNTIFQFGSALVALFISVYLFVYTNSIPLMCLYIVFRIGMFPFFFIFGYKLSRKYPFTITYSLGLILITIALIFTLAVGDLFARMPYMVLVVATIIGIGEGFYYFSANTCNQIVSTNESRNQFLSFNGIFSNITNLLAPVFATFVLANSDNDMAGYRKILMSIIVIFILVIFVALSMNKRSEDTKDNLKEAFVLSFKEKRARDHSWAVFFYGLLNALSLNLISILVYQAAQGGDTYSKLQVLFSFITIVSFYVVRRFMNRETIAKTFTFGVVLRMAGFFILVFIPTLPGAIAFGVCNYLSNVFYDNCYNYLSANIIGCYRDKMTAMVVVREAVLSFARCLAMGFVILCYFILPEGIYLQFSVITLSFSAIVVEKILLKYK